MTIAEKLEALFAQTAGQHGRPVTLQEITNRIQMGGISTMSLSYLQQLRTGQAQNPRLLHLRALADAFAVPPSYFVDEGSAGSASEFGLTPMEQAVTIKLRGLSNDTLATILALVKIARRSEQLDPQGDTDSAVSDKPWPESR